MVLTGVSVSAFYSAVAAWILGYLVEALRGQLSGFSHPADVAEHYAALMANPIWGLSFHFLFLGSCVLVLMTGVQHGIERGNKIMMPLLIFVLFALVLKGLSLPNASEGLKFLFAPDWSVVTAPVVLAALGQSFFTLSVGQGTMITYGSYLNRETNIPVSCYPIALIDTAISLLSAVVVFTVVFSVGLEPTAGEGLLFNTLPIVFSQLPGGYLMAVFFFLLVTLAALTSEISAMEPLIAYLMDEWGWSRRAAVLLCGAAAFALGVPCALSSSLLVDVQIMGRSILGFLAFWATDVFVPIGGLLAVLLVGWRWGLGDAMQHLKRGAGTLFERRPWLETYFRVCIKYLAPCLIVLVFAHELGWI
jgi:NSS family neurotransmitter:Na+ symporter